jgi:2-polyprenyl-6-methoxyphenol hydroxylase-like FAD-dependent oxidoreductase
MPADFDVIVVGAGPVGLALAIELGMRGVRVLVAERNLRGGTSPRAKTTNVRTRTHLRRWGLADRLAAASPLGVDYPNDVIFVTRLSQHRLAHFSNAFNGYPDRADAYPEHAQWVPQYTLEKVMLEHARTLPGVDVRFGATLTGALQDAGGVTAMLQTAGEAPTPVSASYLVGADGARSTVRDLIGATMEGTHGLSRNYNIVFRAPGLAQAHGHGRAIMYWQVNADGASLIGPMDKDDIWFFMPTGMKEGETLSNEAASAAIRKATGIDLPYEIRSTDEWTASQLLADRYSDGRIFLAGDACHLHPPFGGYGMNMGVGDGVDLGWKMAATLHGWGGPGLLRSYQAERRPVHQAVIAEAVANHAVLGGQLWTEGLEDDTPRGEALRRDLGTRILSAKSREFNTLGTVLGACYDHSPIITAGGRAPLHGTGQSYHPCASPGCLAPHAWLRDGRSLYDLFGLGFSLVVTDDADAREIAAAERDAAASATPLKVVRAQGAAVRSLYKADFTLVRPDQHVAWQGMAWAPSALQRAAGRSCIGAVQGVALTGAPASLGQC